MALNNRPKWYNGILYPSTAEANYAASLDEQKRRGLVKWWKRQVPFRVFDETKAYTVITDFLVMIEREEIHEVKSGYYSDEFIYKSQLWLKYYPSFPYFVCEPTSTGYSKVSLAEFIKPHLQVQPGEIRKWKPWEVWCSKMFYKMACKIIK